MYTNYVVYCTYHCMIAFPSLVCLDLILVASTFAPSYVFKPRSLRVNDNLGTPTGVNWGGGAQRQKALENGFFELFWRDILNC